MKLLIVQYGAFYGVTCRLISLDEEEKIRAKLGAPNGAWFGKQVDSWRVDNNEADVFICEPVDGRYLGFDTGMWDKSVQVIKDLLK